MAHREHPIQEVLVRHYLTRTHADNSRAVGIDSSGGCKCHSVMLNKSNGRTSTGVTFVSGLVVSEIAVVGGSTKCPGTYDKASYDQATKEKTEHPKFKLRILRVYLGRFSPFTTV